jgi:peptide/nickel transport system substrate-binding protein
VTRRVLIAVGVAAALVAMAVASLASGSAGTASTRAAAAQTLVIAAGADGSYENPKLPSIGKYPVNANIFDTLVRMTPSYKVVPDLAVRWKFIRPNTWRFFLRRGVRFQNGKPFDARAVVYTMHELATSGSGAYIGIDKKAKIRSHGRYVVDITPSFPNRRLVEQLVHPENSIDAPGSKPSHPVGTGPFKFVSYRRNQQITVERWSGYWGKKPKLAKLVFRFVPDANSRVLALESGSVKAAFDIPRESASDVASHSGLRVARSPVGAYEALYFDIRGASGYDLGKQQSIRKAVELAINRQVIVRNVWRGNAAVVETMVPPSILGRYKRLVQGFSYNAAKARSILNAGGWKTGSGGIRSKNGRKLSLTLVDGFPNADIHGSMPEALQAMLRQVGIDLKVVKAPDENTYSDLLSKGQGDLFAEIGNQNDANPCFLPDLLFYFKGTSHGDYGYRFGPGGTFDRIIRSKCRAGVSDGAAQHGAAQAMQILVDKKQIVVPIAGVFRIYGVSRKLHGFHPNPSQTNQDWTSVSVSS